MDIANMHIVSVDDNKSNLLIVEAYAKALDLHVKSFLDPKEALEALKISPCDLLITDYMMPEMNGVEFVKAFRLLDENIFLVVSQSGVFHLYP